MSLKLCKATTNTKLQVGQKLMVYYDMINVCVVLAVT